MAWVRRAIVWRGVSSGWRILTSLLSTITCTTCSVLVLRDFAKSLVPCGVLLRNRACDRSNGSSCRRKLETMQVGIEEPGRIL